MITVDPWEELVKKSRQSQEPQVTDPWEILTRKSNIGGETSNTGIAVSTDEDPWTGLINKANEKFTVDTSHLSPDLATRIKKLQESDTPEPVKNRLIQKWTSSASGGGGGGKQSLAENEKGFLGEWMGANWRDVKSIPRVVAGGVVKGAGGIADTALSLLGIDMNPQGKITRSEGLEKYAGRDFSSLTEEEKKELMPALIKRFNELRQQKLLEDKKAQRSTFGKIFDAPLELLKGGSDIARENVTKPVMNLGQKIVDTSSMNPIGKKYFQAVGEILPTLPVMGVFAKSLGTVKGLAAYNAITALPESEKISDVALAALKGGAMGKISQLAEVIKPRIIRALVEGASDLAVSTGEKGIRTGDVSIDNQQIVDGLTGLALSYGLAKKKISPEEIKKLPISKDFQTEMPAARAENAETTPAMENVSPATPSTVEPIKKPGEIKPQESLYEYKPDDSLSFKTPAEGGYTAPEPGMKISQYRTNTMEKNLSPEALKNTPETDYLYKPQKETDWESEASKRLDADFNGEINRLLQKTSLEGGEGAIVDEISLRLDSQGRYAELADFTRKVTPKITETARGLRSIGIKNPLSPERILQTAERSRNEAQSKAGKNFEEQLRRHLKDKEFLDEDFTRSLMEKAKQIEAMPEGRKKDVAQAEALKMIADRLPKPLLRIISSIQVIHQLLNVKTALRNGLGNAGFAVIDSIAKNIAGVPIDLVLSKITGRRSIARTSGQELGEYRKGFAEGWKEGLEDIKAGIDTSGIKLKRRLGNEGISLLTSKGETAGNVLSPYEVSIGTFKNPFYKALEKTTGILIRVPDRAAYEATFRSSLENQMRAAKVKAPTSEMLADAHIDGLYRTFQDTTQISIFAKGLKKLLNLNKEFGLGDFVLKYPKTPANLIARAFDYSPGGFLRGVFKVFDVIRNKGKGKHSQRAAALTLGRGIAGSTSLYAVGYGLYNLGILILPSEDKKEANLERASGIRNFSINVNGLKRYITSGFNPDAAKRKQDDVFASVDWFEPIATSLTMGAAFSKHIKELPPEMPAPSKFLSGVLLAMKTGLITATDKPLFQGTLQLFRSKNLVDGLFSVLKNAPASFIPTLASQLRYTIDPKIRDTRDNNRDPIKEALNIALNKIPGLSETLPEKINITGKPQTVLESGDKEVDALVSFNSPAIISQYEESPGMKMVREVYKETGNKNVIPKNVTENPPLTIRGKNFPLTIEQKNRYQEMLGQEITKYLDNMALNPTFQKLAPERKALYISRYLTRIGNRIERKFKYELQQKQAEEEKR